MRLLHPWPGNDWNYATLGLRPMQLTHCMSNPQPNGKAQPSGETPVFLNHHAKDPSPHHASKEHKNPVRELLRDVNANDFGWVEGQRPVPFDGQTLTKSAWKGQGQVKRNFNESRSLMGPLAVPWNGPDPQSRCDSKRFPANVKIGSWREIFYNIFLDSHLSPAIRGQCEQPVE